MWDYQDPPLATKRGKAKKIPVDVGTYAVILEMKRVEIMVFMQTVATIISCFIALYALERLLGP